MHTVYRWSWLFLAALGLAPGVDAADGSIASDAWTRPALARGLPIAAYATLTDLTGIGDVLLAVEAPNGRAEVHETASDGGTMRMRKVDELKIPARGRVVMQPGGVHIMITGFTTPLKPGDTLPLTLRFKQAGEAKVSFEVRAP